MPSYAQETGVIKVGTLAKIRRLYFRDKQSIKEICRQTGMSRNIVRSWLRDPEMVEPKYPPRVVVSKLDAYSETLSLWLKADSGRGKRERRTKGQMWQALCELGYTDSYGRVCAFARLCKIQEGLGLPREHSSRSSSDRAKLSSLIGAPSTPLSAGSGGASSWHTPSCAPAAPSGWWPTPGRATQCCLTHTPERLKLSAVYRSAAFTTI